MFPDTYLIHKSSSIVIDLSIILCIHVLIDIILLSDLTTTLPNPSLRHLPRIISPVTAFIQYLISLELSFLIYLSSKASNQHAGLVLLAASPSPHPSLLANRSLS